jgi:hypothetical protein
MRRTTNLLLAIGVAGLAVLAQPQDAAAQSDNSPVVKTEGHRTFTLNACGDLIRISGPVEIMLIDQKSQGGHTTSTFHVRGHGEGVGSSGSHYMWRENTLLSDRRNGNNANFVTDLNWRSRVIGKGKAPNYHFTLQSHITVNADGDLTARFYASDVQCR